MRYIDDLAPGESLPVREKWSRRRRLTAVAIALGIILIVAPGILLVAATVAALLFVPGNLIPFIGALIMAGSLFFVRGKVSSLITTALIAVIVLFSPTTTQTFTPLLMFFGIYGLAFFYLHRLRAERIWTVREYFIEHIRAFTHPVMAVRVAVIGCVAVSVIGSVALLFSGASGGWFTVIGVTISAIQLVWAGYSLAALRAGIERAEQEKQIRGLRNLLISCGVRRSTVAGLDISVDDLTFTIESPPAEMLNSVLAERVDRSLREVYCAVEAWDDRSIRVVAVIPEYPGEGLEIPEVNAARQPAYSRASSSAGGTSVALDLSNEDWGRE